MAAILRKDMRTWSHLYELRTVLLSEFKQLEHDKTNKMTCARQKHNFYRGYNISAKFQLHPPYGFPGGDFLIFFSQIWPFSCHGNQLNSEVWTKFIYLVEDYSRNIYVKLLSKYLQWDSNKGLLSLFPLQVNGNLFVIAMKRKHMSKAIKTQFL